MRDVSFDPMTLLASLAHGGLATLLEGGHPYVSWVAYAVSGESPIMLLSDLAEHTKNLRRDPRASLLVLEPGEGDPLARARATFVGRCVLVEGEEVAAAYVAAHPEAEGYLGMRDFGMWRLEIEAVRAIGGFGKMGWTPGRPGR